ncbi:MAG: spondin domain-containing protein [Gammaproteobacteria bacterium]|nr:spondin domain-containing protein [Gammaproteobacteria bacterium]
MRINSLKGLTVTVIALLGAAACDSDSSTPSVNMPPVIQPPQVSYDVTVLNATNAQPLSPIAIIAHDSGYSVFSVGSSASGGLEEMAEGGDNTSLIAEADADGAVVLTASGAAPIGPAGSETVRIFLDETDRPRLRISVATMLVNTNDAFTALNAWPVDSMAVGDVMTVDAVAYDAGTELDSESAATIPGPAGGGEGFNAARDDEGDRISMHSGVVSGDDGLAGSDLTEQHRFDNPVARIRIERIS